MEPSSVKKVLREKRGAAAIDTSVTMTLLQPDNPLPLLIQPAADGLDLIAWAASYKDRINELLLDHGGLLFRGFDIGEAGDLEGFIKAVSGELLPYKERSSPRHQVKGNIYTSTDYPAGQSIFLHNENSYQHSWPMKVFFLCVTPASEGGETPIADCRKVLARIDPTIKDQLIEKGFRIVRNFGSGMGLAWQTVFQTESQDEINAYCRQNGVETLWQADGSLRTITHRPAVSKHPVTGEPTWFNHGAFFHVSTLDPALCEVLLACMDEEDLPTNTYWGDGTPFDPEVLDHIRKAYLDEAVLFPWEKGDILLVDNMYTAHARQPFSGERKIVVGMSEAISRGPDTNYP